MHHKAITYPLGTNIQEAVFLSNSTYKEEKNKNKYLIDGYRYGFNGMEKDDEVKGNDNSYDFGARMYDPRVGRWLSVDALEANYPELSPYNFVSNSPTNAVDPDGNLIIFINGEAPVEEQGNHTYWVHSHSLINAVGTFANRVKDYNTMFRNGDQTEGKLGSDWPLMREMKGRGQAAADFEQIKASLKDNMKDGKITETVKIITHSKGSAHGNGYASKLNHLLNEWKEAEPDLFEGNGGEIELVVHLAPHQSDAIKVQKNDYPTISVTHAGDVLSDDDASGDIVNIKTETPEGAANSHTVRGFWGELNKIWDQHKKNKQEGNDKYNGFDGLLDNQEEFKSPSEEK